MADLKPCPFCGGDAEVVTGECRAAVVCTVVPRHRIVVDGDNNAANEATEEWNRREPAPHSPEGEDAETEYLFSDLVTFLATVGASTPDGHVWVTAARSLADRVTRARLRNLNRPSDDLADALNMIRTMVNLIEQGFPEQAAANGRLKIETLAPSTGEAT